MATGIKTLTELGGLMGQRSAANEERLLSFLEVYQAQNNGLTPTYAAMANQLGILEEGVRILLAKLENKGKLHFISKNPPRIMLVGRDTVLPHEPTAADMGLAKEGAAGRFLDAEGERMRLGRYCANYEREHGYGPSLASMVEFVGWAKLPYVRRMAEILAERGLLQYGHGVPTRLTAQGRAFFGLKEHGEMENGKPKSRIVIMKDRKPAKARVNSLLAILAQYKSQVGESETPRFIWLASKMGYRGTSGSVITGIFKEAEKQGLVKLISGRGYASVQFTEKGKVKFMPETVTAEPSEAPPEITFTDRVAPDSPVRAAARAVFAEQPQPMPEAAMRSPYPIVDMERPAGQLAYVETPALIMELIERGYTVRKG